MSLLAGIHPVREALVAGRPIERVLVARGAAGPRIQELIDLCRNRRVSLRFEPREALDRLAPGTPHQGVVAVGAAERYAQIEEVLPGAQLLVVLDGIEDPHNLGAILRTAYAAGASAVILPERRAAGLTEAAGKAAAGALAVLPVVRVANISRTLETLKAAGIWTYGLDERGETSYIETQWTAPTAIVLGSEGKGLHQQVKRHCDFLVRIPMAGQIASLNVSVAAGIVLFEWRRRQEKSERSGKGP
jgi:23S rRNA (guanosine2251-2'-O)-methyltransferase